MQIIKAQENSDFGLLVLITALQDFRFQYSGSEPCYMQHYATQSYLCGCSEPTLSGRDTYSDYHCATCHRELWTRHCDSLQAVNRG